MGEAAGREVACEHSKGDNAHPNVIAKIQVRVVKLLTALLIPGKRPPTEVHPQSSKESEYQALAELDASGNSVAIETLKLEHEGWERDYEVGEPSEPTFEEPRPQ